MIIDYLVKGKNMSYLVNMIILLLACVPLSLLSAPPQSLADYKDVYERELAKIQVNNTMIEEANKRYIKALDVLEGEFKRAGNFPDTKVVMDEKLRFSSIRIVPEMNPEGMPLGVKEAQNRYRSALSSVTVERNARVIRLSQLYVNALKKHIATLLEQNRMIEAEVVNQEIQQAEVAISKAKELNSIAMDVQPAVEGNESGYALPSSLRLGMVLLYSFDKDEGGKITDKSKSSNEGRSFGSRWVKAGKRGGACEFDGKGAYIDAGPSSSLKPDKAFTYSIWLKCSESQTMKTILSCHTDAAGGVVLGIDDVEPNVMKFQLNSWPSRVTSKLALNDGIWHHIAAVYDGKILQLYVDGVLDGAQFHPGRLSYPPGGRFTIGKWFGGAQYFSGLLDEIMVYDRALSEKDIMRLYKVQK